ncbi:MAG: stage II sporulation protein M [Chloroflexota bacterium]|nr:stage II sporulation protein M [Chloroflexota bacterium]
MIDEFVAERKARWERLGRLTRDVRRGRVSRLSAAEIEEFGRLYREATSDLARARRDFPDSPTTLYLNGLVAHAHRFVYRAREGRARAVRRFFLSEFPAAFRRTSLLVLIGFLAFLLPALLAYVASLASPEAAAVLAPAGITERIQEVNRTGRWADISAGESSLAASTIMTNNIRVAIMAFAGGMLLGVPTLLVLALNGLMLGSVAALAQRGGAGTELWSFVSPHGWIELSVIFISGGAGLGLARAVLLPGLLTRRDALVAAAREAVRLLMGGAALLVVAGTIEGFISPTGLPPVVKYAFGLLTGVALFAYLLLAGRASQDEEESAAEQGWTTPATRRWSVLDRGPSLQREVGVEQRD